MPEGTMTVQYHAQGRLPLSGHERMGTIVITYTFRNGESVPIYRKVKLSSALIGPSPGIQGPDHPNPGRPYTGTSRYAYLPDTAEGEYAHVSWLPMMMPKSLMMALSNDRKRAVGFTAEGFRTQAHVHNWDQHHHWQE